MDLAERGSVIFNNSRMSTTDIAIDARPSWWTKLVGAATIDIPEESLLSLSDRISMHIFNTYFTRPKYALRRALDVAETSFDLAQDSCVFMHIRRGDAIIDGDAR